MANYLANEFNKHLEAIPDFSLLCTPQLKFLSCSVLLLEDPDWPTGERGVLIEKMLDTDRFRWVKWNDNNGLVDGKREHVPIDVDFELKELKEEKNNLYAIAESDEDSDDDDSMSDVESDDNELSDVDAGSDSVGVNPSDYLRECLTRVLA